MSNLQVVENQPITMSDLLAEVLPELRVDENGVCYASIRAVAKLCGICHSTLSRYVTSGAQGRAKIIKSLNAAGFEGGALPEFSTTGIPDKAIAVIIGVADAI